MRHRGPSEKPAPLPTEEYDESATKFWFVYVGEAESRDKAVGKDDIEGITIFRMFSCFHALRLLVAYSMLFLQGRFTFSQFDGLSHLGLESEGARPRHTSCHSLSLPDCPVALHLDPPHYSVSKIRELVNNAQTPITTQLWRLQDLRDGGLVYMLELFVSAIRSSKAASHHSTRALYIGHVPRHYGRLGGASTRALDTAAAPQPSSPCPVGERRLVTG